MAANRPDGFTFRGNNFDNITNSIPTNLTYYGIQIFENPYLTKKPRFQMSDKCTRLFQDLCTASNDTQHHIDEFNEWARLHFGEDDQMFIFEDRIIASPAQVRKLASAIRNTPVDKPFIVWASNSNA